jgi:hypothetical protein
MTMNGSMTMEAMTSILQDPSAAVADLAPLRESHSFQSQGSEKGRETPEDLSQVHTFSEERDLDIAPKKSTPVKVDKAPVEKAKASVQETSQMISPLGQQLIGQSQKDQENALEDLVRSGNLNFKTLKSFKSGSIDFNSAWKEGEKGLAAEEKESGKAKTEVKKGKRYADGLPLVNVAMKFQQFFEVNALKMTFVTDFILIAAWFDEELIDQDLTRLDWQKKFFRPDFDITNQKDIVLLDAKKAMQPRAGNKRSPKDGNVRMTQRRQGALHGTFELEDFPFDSQALWVEVRCRAWNKREPELQISLYDKSIGVPNGAMVDGFIVFPEVTAIATKTDPKGSTKGETHSVCLFKSDCQRIYQSYLYHVFPVLFCISCLAWVTFTISPIYIVDRLTTIATVILTYIAYKFVLDEKIPNVHYLTVLDKYSLATFAFLVLVAIESSFFFFYGAADCPLAPDLYAQVFAAEMAEARDAFLEGDVNYTDSVPAGFREGFKLCENEKTVLFMFAIFWTATQVYMGYTLMVQMHRIEHDLGMASRLASLSKNPYNEMARRAEKENKASGKAFKVAEKKYKKRVVNEGAQSKWKELKVGERVYCG